MSCEQNRHKFFQIMAGSGVTSAEELERVYQQHRHTPGSNAERMAAGAKTRMLFQTISSYGLKPPTHAADGMPKAESQPGYAAVYDLLKKQGLLGEHAQLKKSGAVQALYAPGDPALGLDGRDADGYDRWGYNKEGFDRNDYDRDGFNRTGWNKVGYNRLGLNPSMADKHGIRVDGYNLSAVDANGMTRHGYSPADGRDADGYDQNGYDLEGFDCDGYNAQGMDRNGKPDPNFMPDKDGFFPDGLDEYGYDEDGYDRDGFDRWGFGRDGYNFVGYDRNGYDRQGKLHSNMRDAEGYDCNGYRQNRQGDRYLPRVDRNGYDPFGFKGGRSFTGYDINSKDSNGQPRKVLNNKGRWVNARYDARGYDENGYDQRGYHRDSGLTAPDEKGRRYNTFGWIHDETTNECFDPANPARRVKNEFTTIHLARRSKREYVVSAPYIPPAPPPPQEPRSFMGSDEYNTLNGRSWEYPVGKEHLSISYTERLNRKPNVGLRRGSPDNKVKNGIRMRCPHCGQFTNGGLHDCPKFGKPVKVTHAGVVFDERQNVLATPYNPDYDPEYDLNYGYSLTTKLDRDGYDHNGYNLRGFNRDGYDRVGYDVFGYDRDGFDRNGYNNLGVNRRGEKRGSSLKDVQDLVDGEGKDLLANEDLARMYGQIATGLIGKPRRVVLKEGGGFATDMKGTIHADPYPLGRDANPRHNLVVTRAGIYHELGHEQFTPQNIWGKVLEVAEGKQDAGLGEGARKMLPRFYNIVEDGRMEREVARTYKGAAEILAASCRLEPRWSEEVGAGVSDSDQVFWALLYTGLPYYRVRSEVRDNMTPRARKVFEELEPLVSRAVRGTPEDAYQAAAHIAKRFEEEGFIKLPPKDSSNPMPKPPQGSGQSQQSSSGQQQQGNSQSQQSSDEQSGSQGQSSTANSSGGDQSKQEDQKGAGGTASFGPQEDEKKGRRKKAKPEDEKDSGRQGKKSEEEKSDTSVDGQSASSAGSRSQAEEAGEESDEFLFGNEVVDAAVRSVEKDAASALENGVRARSRANTIGRPLHNALPDTSAMQQRYKDANGLPQNVFVFLPKGGYTDELRNRRGRHKEVATMMTKPLKAIREQAEQRLRRQSQGRLDRRQLVNAYKGMDDVYADIKKKPQTSFAASLMVDLSGSMRENVSNKNLYDSVMTLGDCFDMLDMPYEVRAFGSSNAQVKALNEPFHPERAAYLASGDMGSTRLSETAGLAHSAMLASEETNKMMICLSDGSLDDHDKTVHILREARRNGVVTFGIFLGRNVSQNRMDELYGKGNWASIQTLSDMPKLVAQRLASIFKSMR